MKVYFKDDEPTTDNLSLQTLALYNIPSAGQHALSSHPDKIVRAALASSPLTDIDIVDALANDKSKQVRRYANTRTSNPRHLTKMVNSHASRRFNWEQGGDIIGSNCVMLAVRNPLMPIKVLTELLNSNFETIAAAAYCNPSTPEKARRKLTRQRANHLIKETIPTIGGRTLLAFELVSANPWMTETANVQQWGKGKYIRNALTAFQTGAKLSNETVHDLLQQNTVAADIAAINKPEFTQTDAELMQNREQMPVPYILGRLVNRFGVPVIVPQRWDTECLSATVWSAQTLCFADLNSMQNGQIAETCKMLGDNQHSWETFIALAVEWHGTYLEAARAACKL